MCWFTITGRTNYFYNIDVKTVKTSNVTLKISWKKLKISIFNIIASDIFSINKNIWIWICVLGPLASQSGYRCSHYSHINITCCFFFYCYIYHQWSQVYFFFFNQSIVSGGSIKYQWIPAVSRWQYERQEGIFLARSSSLIHGFSHPSH